MTSPAKPDEGTLPAAASPDLAALRAMEPDDAEAVLAIYGEGIATGHATFQETVPDFQVWDRAHLSAPRLVAECGGRVAGWAALAPVSARPVYRGVAEVSVYVAEAARGRGVGDRLMAGLVERAEALGFWTLQAGIFPENTSSLELHRRHGFRAVGVRERIGRMTFGPMAGRWRDVVLLERRSTVAGRE